MPGLPDWNRLNIVLITTSRCVSFAIGHLISDSKFKLHTISSHHKINVRRISVTQFLVGLKTFWCSVSNIYWYLFTSGNSNISYIIIDIKQRLTGFINALVFHRENIFFEWVAWLNDLRVQGKTFSECLSGIQTSARSSKGLQSKSTSWVSVFKLKLS